MSAAVTPHDFPAIRWHGHWIWVPEEPIEPSGFFPGGANLPAKEAHGLFRKTVHLDRVPVRAPARVTADSRYALAVNGREAVRRPIRSQPRRLHYDLIDLVPLCWPLGSSEPVPARVMCAMRSPPTCYYAVLMSHWLPHGQPQAMHGYTHASA